MKRPRQQVRTRFILSAAAGLALALVVGYPVGGYLAENYRALELRPDSATAFHLAKAGVDRALWQINFKKVDLDALMQGKPVQGLDGDVAFNDVPGGSYRVKVRYLRHAGEFQILGMGTDAQGGTRLLELVLRSEPGLGLVQNRWREVPNKV